jgi:hypothetical protein
VFDLIRDDEAFRMLYMFFESLAFKLCFPKSYLYRRDKRPYEFVDKDEHNNTCVKQRIPDATMGLSPYRGLDRVSKLASDLSGCNNGLDDCEVNNDSIQQDGSLRHYNLRVPMYESECGLVVDGIWGKFPFAVNEAKKSASTWEQAEDQIYHAFKVYLAMLYDLARDPLDITKYQCKNDARHQMFGFTSCGSIWKVYIAWIREERCVRFDVNVVHFPSTSFDQTIASGIDLEGRRQRLHSGI